MKMLSEYLSCPECSADIDCVESGFVCRSCKKIFPVLGNIPWLQKDVSFQIEQWKAKFQLEQKMMSAEELQLKAELNDPNLLPSTRKRLNKVLQAKVEHRKSIHSYLDHLNLNLSGTSHREQIFRTKLPESIRLMGYGPNVFRDWAWESGENERSVALFRKTTGIDSLEQKSVLTLGAGACRFAYDIHLEMKAGHSVASDINPFLLAVAERCIRGASCSLQEFPVAPIDDNHVSISQKLSAPQKNLKNFHILAADGINFPGKRGAFDWVITPWFIDIIDLDSQILAKRINHLLKPGGRWFNFGTLVFRHKQQALNYGRAEMREVLAAAGFGDLHESEDLLPYLDSSSSAQKRSELVWSFCATKSREISGSEVVIERTPSWLQNVDEPVPKLADFERDLAINEGYNLIVQKVDGTRSVGDIAKEVAGHFQLSHIESVAMVRQLFEILWTKSGKNQRY
jgi:hypothetical protein